MATNRFPQPLSMKPSAIRMRRKYARDKAIRQGKTPPLPPPPPGPVTTWRCGCGYRVAIRGTLTETLREFETLHGERAGACMFIGQFEAVQTMPQPAPASSAAPPCEGAR